MMFNFPFPPFPLDDGSDGFTPAPIDTGSEGGFDPFDGGQEPVDIFGGGELGEGELGEEESGFKLPEGLSFAPEISEDEIVVEPGEPRFPGLGAMASQLEVFGPEPLETTRGGPGPGVNIANPYERVLELEWAKLQERVNDRKAREREAEQAALTAREAVRANKARAAAEASFRAGQLAQQAAEMRSREEQHRAELAQRVSELNQRKAEADRLQALREREQGFREETEKSRLLSNPRSIIQGLLMLGLSPDEVRKRIAGTPWANQLFSQAPGPFAPAPTGSTSPAVGAAPAPAPLVSDQRGIIQGEITYLLAQPQSPAIAQRITALQSLLGGV